jgi:hypothetical protein
MKYTNLVIIRTHTIHLRKVSKWEAHHFSFFSYYTKIMSFWCNSDLKIPPTYNIHKY